MKRFLGGACAALFLFVGPMTEEVMAAPNCTAAQLTEIKRFTTVPTEISCNITLSAGEFIRRPIIFNGAASSNVTINCNGGTIAVPASAREDVDAIQVQSKKVSNSSNPALRFSVPQNITVKNCNVSGGVRIRSSYYTGGSSNAIGPSGVLVTRQTSPKNITFDNLNITNANTAKRRVNAVYFESGVTYSTLKNSKVIHDGKAASLYLAPNSGHNTIYNNEFHNDSDKRELMSLDGTEHNTIEKNWFSGLKYGGIFLYRNCGESGNTRYGTPRKNSIKDNIFYYKSSNGKRPAIYIGSRATVKNDQNRNHCPDDRNNPHWDITDVPTSLGWDSDWEASSSDDRDFARHNTVTGNRICNKTTSGKIVTQIPSFNHSNVISGTSRITCSTSTPIPR